MSKIDELIQKLCPDGVEYKKVKDVCETITDYTAAGSFADLAKNVIYIKNTTGFAQLIRTTDLKANLENEDNFIYVNEHAFNYLWRVNLNEECLVLPNVGNCGEIYHITPDIFKCENNVLGPNAILVKSKNVNMKFLFFIFSSYDFQEALKKIITSTGQTKFNKTNFKELKLPIPPIEVQDEIVRILDNFTELKAELSTELKAELSARQKQYEYYRDKLLAFDNTESSDTINTQDHVLKNIKIKDIFKRVKGTSITAGKMKEIANEEGNIRIFAGGKTMINALEEDIPNANIINIPAVLVQSRGLIDFIYYDKPFTFKNEMWAYTCENKITLKYLYYVLKNNIEYFRNCASCMGSMPQISLPVTEEFKITLPSLEKQEKVVSILDKFETYTNDLTTRLSAEISLRQKQYEYYRNKLLSFKQIDNN